MVDIKISGRKVGVSDSLREHVEEKVSAALKVFDIKPMTCDVVLRVDKNPSNPERKACEITVFPHPNAPGMQHVPPSTDGNSVSMMRWPVISGWFPGSFSITGRELRTGHRCDIVSLLTTPVVSSRTSSSVSFSVSSSFESVSPPYTFTTVPFRFGGHMMLCSGISSFSYTTPNISPPEMISPSLK